MPLNPFEEVRIKMDSLWNEVRGEGCQAWAAFRFSLAQFVGAREDTAVLSGIKPPGLISGERDNCFLLEFRCG